MLSKTKELNSTMFASSLKVVVLTRNRREYLIQSLLSVIQSASLLPKNIRVNIEISDNSDNDDIVELVEKQFPQVAISLRRPNISFNNHMKRVIREANADYLVVFHDDDVMKPCFLPVLLALLVSNSSAAAVGCNAYYMRDNLDTNSLFMNPNEATILIDTKDKLLNGYFLIGKRGTSPLPGYMYRVNCISDVGLDESKGGIHADVSFLLDILQRGPILLTTEILMSYRLHDTNLNNDTSVPIQYAFLRYLKSQVSMENSQALQDFRYTIMIRWFREQSIDLRSFAKWSRRQNIVFKYIVYELLKHMLRPDCRALHFKVIRDKYVGILAAKLSAIRHVREDDFD